MEETFAIFKVYDYKGGELYSSININRKEFISNLSEEFEYYFEDEENVKTLEDVKSVIISTLENKNEFYSLYAGGDGFTGRLYKIKNNKLKEVQFKDYIDDIAQYIFENWEF